MIYFTFEQTYFRYYFGSCLILFSTWFFVNRNDFFKFKTKKIIITGLFTVIPFLISLESNLIDWILLSGIICCLIYGIFELFKKSKSSQEIFLYCTLYWLAMTWGGWTSAATMIIYSTIESFLSKELKFLVVKTNKIYREISRIILITIFPLVVWYSWWAALGQIDGLAHPRDVDPGNIFLNGGYIGDRFSPSNAWVGFMGAGATAAMSMMWWSLFKKFGWPVHYVALLLVLGIAFNINAIISFSKYP